MTDQPKPLTHINCRAQVTEICSHGKRIDQTEYFKEDPKDPVFAYMADKTFHREDGSIVCDPCYLTLGMPPASRLEQAIRHRKEMSA